MAKNVKELIKEVEGAIGVLESVKSFLTAGEGETAPVVADKKASKKAPAKDEGEEEAGADSREAELEAMSYNEIKALVSKLGGKAVGKKPDLISQIIKLEADGADAEDEEEEEEVEEAPKAKRSSTKGGAKAKKVEEPEEEEEEAETEADSDDEEEEVTEEGMREQLGEFELDELKDIAKEAGVSIKSKATKSAIINALVKDLAKLDETLEAMGYYDEEEDDADAEADEADGEEESEDGNLADKLAELELEDLAEICADNGLSGKGKKQAVIDRIVEAVEKGDIDEADIFEGEDSEEDSEEDEEEGATVEDIVDELELADLKKVAKELEIAVTKTSKAPALKKAILAEDEDAVYEALVALGLADADEEDEEDADDSEEESEDEDDVEVSAKVTKAEDALEKDLRAKIKAGKIKDATMKKFLEKYYDGDPDCKYCNGECSKEERIDCYIKIQRKLVDDDCETNELSNPYTRGDIDFCCGHKLVEGTGKKKGTLICEICGEEYDIAE